VVITVICEWFVIDDSFSNRGRGGGFNMTDSRIEDRRTSSTDRRVDDFDRRQFVDISWPRDKERRLSGDDRRQGEDRRS
jgi:hypothetical protein